MSLSSAFLQASFYSLLEIFKLKVVYRAPEGGADEYFGYISLFSSRDF